MSPVDTPSAEKTQCTPQELYSQAIHQENHEKNYEKAFELFKQAAEAGHAKAASSVGDLYHLGKGVESNPEEAARWWEQAADQHDPKACFNIGIYHFNKKTPDDLEIAIDWFEKAAMLDHAPAQHHLSHLYFEGTIIRKNTKKAYKLAYKAAMNGTAASQVDLALMYATGNAGPGKDLVEAYAWASVASTTLSSDKILRVQRYLKEGMGLDARQLAEARRRGNKLQEEIRKHLSKRVL